MARSAFESLLRRDRLILLMGLVLVVALAAAWVVSGVGMGMSALDMTTTPALSSTAGSQAGGMMMAHAVWTPGYALLMAAMWAVMMTAMMLPSAAPLLLIYLRMARNADARGVPLAPTGILALGYILAWCGFSVVAAVMQWALEEARLLSPMLQAANVWLGAGILIAAGAWQLTPIKAVCLRHCRSPIGFLTSHWRAGHWGAFRMGLSHGAYCLGCCWFLMALLFFGGVMNLYWIAGLAIYVLVEKTMPFGHWIGWVAGTGLIVWGLALLVLQHG